MVTPPVEQTAGVGSERSLTAMQVEGDVAPPDDPAVRELAIRLAVALAKCRPESMFNVECFLMAVEREMGGTLVIENASKRRKRSLVEIRYAAEGFKVSEGVASIEFS